MSKIETASKMEFCPNCQKNQHTYTKPVLKVFAQGAAVNTGNHDFCLNCHMNLTYIKFDKESKRYFEENIEKKILESLDMCWSSFIGLEQTHPNDTKEFHRAIHDLKRIINLRSILRN